ncbi:MAG TPA: hypothetical protein VFY01_10320 [Rheinheimera sp.]|nr:hypothetical protein [Rheinheimera sp.]
MKTPMLLFVLLAVLLMVLSGCASKTDAKWETFSPREQKEVDAHLNAFLGRQLFALRSKLQTTPCRLSVLETQPIEGRYNYTDKPEKPPKNCGETWDNRERQFWQRWRSGSVEYSNSSAVRSAVAWPGNRNRLKTLLEQHLQPLAKRDFQPYVPYGWYENVAGTEYLLRDGRTILGVSFDTVFRNGGESFKTHVQFSVFDVRRLPGKGRVVTSYKTYGRGNAPDNFDTTAAFGESFDPPGFRALANWGKQFDIGRKVDTRLLDPAQAMQVQIEPELAELGRGLAEQRWERLQFVGSTLAQIKRQQRDRARIAESPNAAWARRERARTRAEWARDGATSAAQTNAIATGIIDGLNSAARTQQFWNARAAEAQARYFHAQYGCQPGFCGGGDHYGADRGRNDSDNGNNKHNHRRDADAAHASSAAAEASGRPESTQTAATSGKGPGSTAVSTSGSGSNSAVGGVASAGAGGTSTVAKPLTHYVTGQYAKAGSEAQACAAAKSMTALKSSDRDKLTGKVADRCVCSNPGAGWQKMLDNDRRKREEATEQWIKDQYTVVIDKRQAKINTEGWSCHANFEVYGAGAPTR